MKETKPFITLSGADERTDLEALAKLNAEIGLLYTHSPDGRNRYPSREWIADASRKLPSCAVHICGDRARQQLFRQELNDLIAHCPRIQVNGRLTTQEVEDLCDTYYTHQIITQHNEGNAHLVNVTSRNHSILIDESGGRGIEARFDWIPSAPVYTPIGFAGGLGPSNLGEQLRNIQCVVAESHRIIKWWVDMELSLRVHDWFSIERATEVVSIFNS